MSIHFPFSSVDDIKLNAKEKSEAAKEKVVDVDDESTFCAISHVPKEVEDHYTFSQYLINTNQFHFRTVVRILSFAFLFIQMLVKNKPESDRYVVFPFNATIACKTITTTQGSFDRCEQLLFSQSSTWGFEVCWNEPV